MDDAELWNLWENARRGDRLARERVCQAIAEKLLETFRGWRFERRDPDREDVLGETVLRLLEKLDRGEKVDNPRLYALGVAHHVLADARKRAEKDDRRTVPLSDAPESPIDDEHLERSQKEERCRYIEEHLTPEEAALLERTRLQVLARSAEEGKERTITHALACKLSRLGKKIRRLFEEFEKRNTVIL